MVELHAAVVLELLGAVVDGDAGALADVLVIGALVGILEAAPAADVVDEDGREVGPAGLNVIDQALERSRPVERQTALARVGVGADDLDAAPRRILADDVGLVLGRVLLVLGRHPDVLGRAHERLADFAPSPAPLSLPSANHHRPRVDGDRSRLRALPARRKRAVGAPLFAAHSTRGECGRMFPKKGKFFPDREARPGTEMR